jgi:hypothetical protein
MQAQSDAPSNLPQQPISSLWRENRIKDRASK